VPADARPQGAAGDGAQDVRSLELVGRCRMLEKALEKAWPVLRFSE
jgi:hypothetical protein